jgi:hypothetical protein
MVRFLVIFCFVFLLQGCKSDPDKYELKSPCVSVDSGDAGAPCQRRPANKWIG